MRFAHTAAGVNTRSQNIPEMKSRRCAGNAGLVNQSRQAEIIPVAHNFEPLPNISPVQTLKRHHVAHGSQCHQIKPLHQIRLLPLCRIKRRGTEFAVNCDDCHKNNSDGRHVTQIRISVVFIQTLGINHRKNFGQPNFRFVMVNDNNVHSLLCGIFQNIECGRPAVNRNQQFRSLSLKVINRLRTGPVAFIPFGNMNFRHTPDRFQKQLQY